MQSELIISLQLHRQEVQVPTFMSMVLLDQFEATLAKINSVLHPKEYEYFSELKSEKRRYSYLMGRYGCKLSLCRYLNEPDMRKIEIVSGYFDQPIVNHESFDTPAVSLSHCSNLAGAIAFPRGHIMGIELGELDLGKIHAFKSQITDAEATLADLKFSDPQTGYHLVWSAKESLSKAIKCGLTVPFKVLEIDEMIDLEPNCYQMTYKNFAQYKCLSWVMKKHVLSITLPKNTSMNLDIYDRINSIYGDTN